MSGRAWNAIGLGLLWVLLTAGASRAQSTSATITSEVLGTDRTIYVRLPAGYDLSSDSYPVLYMTDGQSIDRMAPNVDSLASAGSVPEMIIVGIPHPNRRSDLTPTHLDEMAGSGGGEHFLRFIGDCHL